MEYSKEKQPQTKTLSKLPIEMCLLIAQMDPLVAIRLHTVNRQFRDLIKANLISLTQTRFLPGIEGLERYTDDWSVKPLLRGLFFYFGKKIAAEHDDLQDDVDLLKQEIRKQFSEHPSLHVRSWILSLQKDKLVTAHERARLIMVFKSARAYYGSQHLELGNDTKGMRRYALSFLSMAETVLVSQFRALYHSKTKSFKVTCSTKSFYKM